MNLKRKTTLLAVTIALGNAAFLSVAPAPIARAAGCNQTKDFCITLNTCLNLTPSQRVTLCQRGIPSGCTSVQNAYCIGPPQCGVGGLRCVYM